MTKATKPLMFALGFITLLAGNAYAGGEILTDKKGMTLYTFDKDSKGSSVCYGMCAEKWPPYLAGDKAKVKKGWGLTTRKDGSKQWTFKGQPLYTWVGDKKAGDTTGDGVKGIWHVAKKKHKHYSSYDDHSSYDN